MSAPLIVLAGVVPGRAEPLREVLRGLPSGADSPFARVAGTHMGRFTVVDDLDRRPDRPAPPAPRSSHLLLSAEVDPPPETWLEALLDAAAGELAAIWSHCADFPGLTDRDRALRWIDDRRVPAGFTVAPYPRATVAEIHAALALRGRLGAFAARAWALAPAELHAAWRALLAGEPA